MGREARLSQEQALPEDRGLRQYLSGSCTAFPLPQTSHNEKDKFPHSSLHTRGRKLRGRAVLVLHKGATSKGVRLCGRLADIYRRAAECWLQTLKSRSRWGGRLPKQTRPCMYVEVRGFLSGHVAAPRDRFGQPLTCLLFRGFVSIHLCCGPPNPFLL